MSIQAATSLARFRTNALLTITALWNLSRYCCLILIHDEMKSFCLINYELLLFKAMNHDGGHDNIQSKIFRLIFENDWIQFVLFD